MSDSRAPAAQAPALRAALARTWGETVALFAHVPFGVSLLAIWAVLTLIGVIVEQGRDPSYYAGAYAPPLARLILRLDIENIYHSPAYIGVLGLIICSMAAATFTKVIPRRIPRLNPVKIDAIPLHARLRVAGDPDAVRARLAAFFSSRGWQVRKRAFGGTEWTFADKSNWARRGVLVAHVGFVLIAVGTTIYWATGYSGQFAVLSGQTATIPQNGTKVALERFAYRIDPVRTKAGIVYQPIDYVSDAKVTARDGVTRDAVIRVNHPYDANGTLIYQSTYGFAIDFRVTHDGVPVPGPDHPLKEGEGFVVDGTTRAIQYQRFVGTIDRATGMPGADPRPNDPGVIVVAFDGDRPIGQALLPLGVPVDLGAGYKLEAARYVLYSGFQYRYDPGIPVVGIGAFVLLAGLCVSLYFVPARLFIIVRESGAGTSEVGVAATTVKGYDVFEDRFREIVEALRRDAPSVPHANEAAPAPVLGAV
ncbi:MAG TPA: cytochrome c biogenesis protein ResB [Candidatus Baltobacteraceae bacterium]|nr:cytochrome c biogenesis protein ResB [Candidatus Baltobacteraceae bacterium]